MQLRSSVPVAFFALFLVSSRNAAAAQDPPAQPTQMLLSEQTTASLEHLAVSLEGQRSYALTERLDEIAASEEYGRIMAHALSELARLDPDGLARAALEFEYEDLYARFKNPHLRPLVARTYAALVATFELTSQRWLEDAKVASDQLLEEDPPGVSIDTFEGPARMRLYLRQILRGNVALMCLPFVGADEGLQLELLVHAAHGAETNLRFAAALSPEPPRARALLEQLRLEPIELEAMERRWDALGEARESLHEARRHVPSFRLPPDPGFQKS